MPADQLRSRDFASTRRPADEGALESAREGSGDRAWRAERGWDGRGEPRRGSRRRTKLGQRFRPWGIRRFWEDAGEQSTKRCQNLPEAGSDAQSERCGAARWVGWYRVSVGRMGHSGGASGGKCRNVHFSVKKASLGVHRPRWAEVDPERGAVLCAGLRRHGRAGLGAGVKNALWTRGTGEWRG